MTQQPNPPLGGDEAKVEPCYECGSTESTGTACKPCNPEITDPFFGGENVRDRLRELAGWLDRGDPGAEGSVMLAASVAQEHANDIREVLAAPVLPVEVREATRSALGKILDRAWDAGLNEQQLDEESLIDAILSTIKGDA